MRKSLSTIIALAACMTANAQTINISEYSPALQLEGLGMSANHRYVTGLNVATYRAFIWDTQNNEVVENDGDYANCDFRAITNDGCAYGILGLDDMVTTNASTFGLDAATSTVEQDMSQIFDVTPDGTIAVGCLLDDMWMPTACIWKNGERTILPCPTPEECGFDHDGANAQYVSADGSVIAGYLQDWHSSRPAIIWRLQADGSYKADVISKDIWELNYGDGKTYLEFQVQAISPNGKWLCLAAKKEAADFMPTYEFMVRMNLETGEITESAEPNIDEFYADEMGFYPSSIADDGTCIGTLQCFDSMRGLYWAADEAAPRYLAEVFPQFDMLVEADYNVHVPVTITADAKHIMGFALPFIEEEDGELYDNFITYLISKDETDGISVLTHNFGTTNATYNLHGQRVGKNNRGIVIRNGKKFLNE